MLAWKIPALIIFLIGVYHTVKTAVLIGYNWQDRRRFNKETDQMVREILEENRKENAELQASGEDQLKEEPDQGGPEVPTPGE